MTFKFKNRSSSTCRVNRIGIFLGVGPSSGGMFQYSQSLVEALISNKYLNYEVAVVYNDSNWAPILKKIEVDGVRLRNFGIGMKIANIFMAMRIPGLICRLLGLYFNPLIKELRTKNCDIWIFPAQDVLTWQIFGVRVIGTIHDLMHRYESRFPEVGSKFRYRLREYRFKNIASNSDVILVDSSVGKEHVVESYQINQDKIHILPYIAPNCLKEGNNRSNSFFDHKLPQKFLFYPAQFWAHKNHYRLIDAIQILSSDYPDIYLVLSGGLINEYKKIIKYVQKKNLEDKVIFLGYVSDYELRELYIRARALIYPTFFGPTNIPPLEAMMLGCPVATSNIYGMPEQCGDAALYFNPLDTFEMAKTIAKIWVDNELISVMIKKGNKIASQKNQAWLNDRFREILFETFIFK